MIERLTKQQLRELFNNQCECCQLENKECNGNKERAKKWNCPRFFNGFVIIKNKRFDEV